jgi:hypothetical protein
MILEEKTHKYIHNNEEYISVTQLLKKYNLSADYTGIPEHILQNAATKGKAIHKALELYIKGDQSMLGLVNEVDLFHNAIIKKPFIDLTLAKAEEIVYDNIFKVAGTIDFQYYNETGLTIIDFKTTSSLHLETIAWQLSIYNYLICKGDVMNYYFNKLQVYHFHNGRLYIKDIHTIDYDQVEELLKANQTNVTEFNYTRPNNIINKSEQALITQILNELNTYDPIIKRLKTELDTILERVKQNMVDQKHYNYATDEIVLTYISQQTRLALDNTKVKEFLTQAGEVVDDYMKRTTVKDTVRARLKNKGGD